MKDFLFLGKSFCYDSKHFKGKAFADILMETRKMNKQAFRDPG